MGTSAASRFRAINTRLPNRMKSNLESSAQEVLAGLVERVTFHNGENGFCVLRAKARGHRDLVTVVGQAATRASMVRAAALRKRCLSLAKTCWKLVASRCNPP